MFAFGSQSLQGFGTAAQPRSKRRMTVSLPGLEKKADAMIPPPSLRLLRASAPVNNPTKKFVLALGLLALAACSKQEQTPAATPAPQQPTAPAPAPRAAQAPKPTSPERIAEIKASGQKGLWATVADVCRDDIKSGVRTTLVWNVEGQAERVVLYVVDQKHGETHFGQGGPVGERETGPWLRPGLSFRIRNFDTKEELGAIEINERAPEACAKTAGT
jgi:hypothetical protein